MAAFYNGKKVEDMAGLGGTDSIGNVFMCSILKSNALGLYSHIFILDCVVCKDVELCTL